MTKWVALILDEEIAGPIVSLFNAMPVWVLSTGKNEAFIESLRHQCEVGRLITTFARKDGENKADLAERILYVLDDHHNEELVRRRLRHLIGVRFDAGGRQDACLRGC